MYFYQSNDEDAIPVLTKEHGDRYFVLFALDERGSTLVDGQWVDGVYRVYIPRINDPHNHWDDRNIFHHRFEDFVQWLSEITGRTVRADGSWGLHAMVDIDEKTYIEACLRWL